jgi:iron(III) transport system permease protein
VRAVAERPQARLAAAAERDRLAVDGDLVAVLVGQPYQVAVGGGVLLALVVGAALAWLNERTDARMGFATDVLPIMPLRVPPIAGAIGWVILASPQAGLLNSFLRDLGGFVGIEMATGPLNIFSWYGVLIVYALYLVPHVFLSV